MALSLPRHAIACVTLQTSAWNPSQGSTGTSVPKDHLSTLFGVELDGCTDTLGMPEPVELLLVYHFLERNITAKSSLCLYTPALCGGVCALQAST